VALPHTVTSRQAAKRAADEDSALLRKRDHTSGALRLGLDHKLFLNCRVKSGRKLSTHTGKVRFGGLAVG
jgi:hypothetical protein